MHEGGNFSVVWSSMVINRDLKKAVKVTVERKDLVRHGAEVGAVNKSIGGYLLSISK